jgi:hypothetical protein
MKNSKTQTIVLSSLYFSGILSYNIFTLYSNSIEQLIEYRKTKQYFKNELDAIVSGCQKNWFDNLLLSLFWPIRLPFKLIPIVILYFNSNDSNENDSFIKYEFKKSINIKNISDTKKYIKTIDKIKKDSYESNKENTEYVKENTPIIKDNENEDNFQENQNDTKVNKLTENEKKIEINEDNSQEIQNDTKVNELSENDKKIEINEDDLKFNFSNFNEEIKFDFAPLNNCEFNFSIKN